MAARFQQFFNNNVNTREIFEASSPSSSFTSEIVPAYNERYENEKQAVEVCGPPPNAEFEPVERQRHFGILHYTVNSRFRCIILVGLFNVLLIIGLFLFVFLYILHSDDSSGPTSNSPYKQHTVTTPLLSTTKSYHQEVTSALSNATSKTPTTNQTPSCNPVSPTTFLFAYSNDFDSHIVSDMWNYFATSAMELYYSKIGTIRFDVRNVEEIQYYNNWRSINASIQSRLPDPSLSFYNPFSGSDILKTIETFLANTQAPVCGSQMVILVKRYPSETEIDEIVAKLRLQQATITFMTSSNPPAEANHPETLYNIATQTHGFCGFDEDKDFIEVIGDLPKGFHHYLIYSANPQVSKQGAIALAPFKVPNFGDYWFSMTIQDHGPKDYSAKVKLSWNNSETDTSGSFGVPDNSAGWYGNHLARWETLDQLVYNINLEYEYIDNKTQILQIRIFSKMPIDFWIPYDD